MDAMYSAIQKRRGGGLLEEESMVEDEAPAPGEGQGGGLKGLVAALDQGQRQELLQLLVKDQGANDRSPEIEVEGAMGPGEEFELERESGETPMERGSHESEDEIMESMVSSADKSRADQGTKPRNLGERVKMDLAKKLKGKGK